MPEYEFKCPKHDRFAVLKPMSESEDSEICLVCGKKAPRVMSTFTAIWPWILTEASHHKGAKDEWVKDKPSNDMIVDNTKSPYIKTVF